ncbi:hypothetical protein G7Y89_g5377 [Cudoniella acicularis]|uniref:Integrase catalytic domain-containing protein n=1 Tax=Cudoniella acicularis TaxID=354080 RepID=A0A8H4RP45_9HELO|nr:hypothetical protein G7Y89_g5377 [Cudoniella acicularis]
MPIVLVIISSILLDNYPLDIHMFIPDTVFQTLYRDIFYQRFFKVAFGVSLVENIEAALKEVFGINRSILDALYATSIGTRGAENGIKESISWEEEELAFLPPKIIQADNGKEFKGALLILLRKFGIQVINGAPRSPQTQGLVEQANGVVEAKLRAWKMDNGSTEWADGILEVTLAMSTQKHSTIGCAPAELLFRERSSYHNWLNSQARKDPTIGVAQEDPTQAPIYTLSPSPSPSPSLHSTSSRIDIGIHTSNSQIIMRISPEASGSEISLQINPPIRSSSIDQWFDIEAYEPGVGSTIGSGAYSGAGSAANSGASSRADLRAGSTANSGASLGTDPVIQKARESTLRARAQMVQKYSKRHDIQHFEVGDIVSVKIPREDRTSTDNKRLYGRELAEPYSHRYQILTHSGIIERLVPTKGLSVVGEALWSDINIPESTVKVTLGKAAREYKEM